MIKQMGTKNPGYIADDEHYSPAWIFQAMQVTFDLDVCAPKGGVPWIPASISYSKEDDGLSKPWMGLVWMNPPYSKPQPWIDRFIEHGNGIALLPITVARWSIDLWQSAEVICVADQRIYFEHPTKKKKPIFWQTAFFGMGKGVEILRQAKIGRTR